MVTNRARQEIVWIAPKKFPKFLRRLAPLTFLIRIQAFPDSLRGELSHVQIFMNCGTNPLTWDAQLLSYNLAEIRRSSKISSWIWSIISGVVTILIRPGRGAKSPLLNWTTQFLTVAYDGACSSNVYLRMAWISFDALPCRKKKTWWELVSRCYWNRVRRLTCFVSGSNEKNLQFCIWTDPSFQWHYRFRLTTLGSRSG